MLSHFFSNNTRSRVVPVNEVNKFHIHAPETSLVRYNYKLLKLMPLSIIYVLQCMSHEDNQALLLFSYLIHVHFVIFRLTHTQK